MSGISASLGSSLPVGCEVPGDSAWQEGSAVATGALVMARQSDQVTGPVSNDGAARASQSAQNQLALLGSNGRTGG